MSRIGRGLARFWKLTNAIRIAVVNLLFLAIVIALVVLLVRDDSPEFADKNALVLAPSGTIVEQASAEGPSFGSLVGGGGGQETLLRDVLETIERAGDDDRVEVLVLDLGKFQDAGMSKLQEIGAALRELKGKGKKVIATADKYSQSAYYLAAQADEIYMHEMGEVSITGLGRYNMYFKDALDRFEVQWHIFRVGKYKSAVEPYLGNEMSAAAREADLEWMGDLWAAYVADVASARGVAEADLLDYAQNYDAHVVAAQGDAATAAVTAGLVDKTGGRDVVRARLIELVGENEKKHDFNRIDADEYLAFAREESPLPERGGKIAVIVARGAIMDGEHPPGTIGGDSTAALIRKARLDEDTKALVLRVDSGGGSAFASEVIRREFQLAREAGKPVVVSMGSVAASGGYWISTSADEIWASPTTITGSIGIFGMFPTFEKTLGNQVGVHVDGVGTTRFAGAHPGRAMDPAFARTMQSTIEHGYHEFIERVANARSMTPEQVDAIAQGRVWSGVDAHAAGLVDQLGGLEDAVAAAAKRADLGEEFHVDYVEPELRLRDRLLKSLLGGDVQAFSPLPNLAGTPWAAVARQFDEQARVLASFNDPRGIYAYALIDVD